jgi:tetratricopeptide (TPR) repeat protein
VRVREAARDPGRAASGGSRRPGPAQPAPAGAPGVLLELQRSAGNRAVGAVLGRAATAAEPAPKLLSWGDHGLAVGWLQLHLDQIAAVEVPLEVDLIFGPETDKAVRQFQKAAKIRVDGIAGPETAAAIDAALAAPQSDAQLAWKVFVLGERAYTRKDYAHAYDFFTRAGELHPLPEITFDRAQALRHLGGRREEALALFQAYLATGQEKRRKDAEAAVAELSPAQPSGDAAADLKAATRSFEAGAADYAAGRYGRAYDEFTRAGELHAAPELVFDRAQALRRLGRDAEALALYRAYLEAGGGNRAADARALIAELETAPTGDAAADAEAAFRAYKTGAAAYGAHHYGEAYAGFARAERLKPVPELIFNEAQSRRREGGHTAEALALFERYLATGQGRRRDDAALFAAQLRVLGAAP